MSKFMPSKKSAKVSFVTYEKERIRKKIYSSRSLVSGHLHNNIWLAVSPRRSTSGISSTNYQERLAAKHQCSTSATVVIVVRVVTVVTVMRVVTAMTVVTVVIEVTNSNCGKTHKLKL